jgi:hypothetical protein
LPTKNAEDAAIKKHGTAVRYRHLGINTAKHPMPGSKASPYRKRMDGTVERRR